MTETAIKALLCDVDGVVRIWDPDRLAAAEDENGIPRGTFFRLAFAEGIAEALTVGRLSMPAWHELIAAGLRPWHEDPEHALRVVLACRDTSSIDTGLLALLAEAARRMPVALVTNGADLVDDELAALGVTAVVPTIVNSAHLGFAKPDPRIYEHAAAVVGVAPHECLFVDDTAGHVAAAEALGMRGLHYRRDDQGLETLAAALRA